jgi:hypothetical protein
MPGDELTSALVHKVRAQAMDRPDRLTYLLRLRSPPSLLSAPAALPVPVSAPLITNGAVGRSLDSPAPVCGRRAR